MSQCKKIYNWSIRDCETQESEDWLVELYFIKSTFKKISSPLSLLFFKKSLLFKFVSVNSFLSQHRVDNTHSTNAKWMNMYENVTLNFLIDKIFKNTQLEGIAGKPGGPCIPDHKVSG